MQTYFYTLSDALMPMLEDQEVMTLAFYGETSDFVRLNHNKIRQAGQVTLRNLSIDLILDARHASAQLSLSGDLKEDKTRIKALLSDLREQRKHLPQDPYLSYAREVNNTQHHHQPVGIESPAALQQIHAAADGTDLVGIWANGIMYSGFANSFGQRNWHSSANFNFDWSCYHAQDKAVKHNYAGFRWEPAQLQSRMQEVQQLLPIIARPAKTIPPGRYRAYLAPGAVRELLDMMSWGGFSLKSHRSKDTPLIEMSEAGRKLAPSISLSEDHARGLAPRFTDSGFIKPDRVQLIVHGCYAQSLVCPRSAIEYNTPANAESETPGSLEMGAGTLAREDILSALDTGLYINNLWYLNFSDRNHCQLTGMTRFACFWVEHGKIQAPLNVMRFDDSLYNLFGEALEALTVERDVILDTSTYERRSDHSTQLPGVLVKAFNLTL